MTYRIHTCEQGSVDWLRARMGKPTASEFATVMASGKDGGDSKTRRTYLLKLAGEIVTGDLAESYCSADMRRGQTMEAEARDLYAMLRDCEPERVGFIENGWAGASPDSLVGANGGLEIKTALPHIQLDRLLKDKLPPEHKAQVQGTLLVAEREWWDFMSYWPKCPPLLVRVYREEPYLATLKSAIDRFNDELNEIVERVRAYGAPKAEAA